MTRVEIAGTLSVTRLPEDFGSPRTRFDFETGAQGWGVGRSTFLLPPASTVATRGRGRRGRGFLRTTCRYAQPGCGT